MEGSTHPGSRWPWDLTLQESLERLGILTRDLGADFAAPPFATPIGILRANRAGVGAPGGLTDSEVAEMAYIALAHWRPHRVWQMSRPRWSMFLDIEYPIPKVSNVLR